MKHTHAPAAESSVVPVSVPLLVLDVHDDGTLTATLDGKPLAPPEGVPAWRRGLFGQIIDHATQDRAIPVRVTVHECDGSTFTDILPAAKRPKPAPAAPVEKSEPVKTARRRRAADPVRVDGGEGFIAGEDVAIALITGHTDATHEGRVRAVLDPAVIAATKAGEVVLVGRVSGMIVVRGLS